MHKPITRQALRKNPLSVRKQRIEHWAYDQRGESLQDQILQSSTAAGSSLEQRRAESSFIQADRRLKVDLYRLGDQREKALERFNFDQKLFANKQALRHKDNSEIQSTLNYVRKCCKFSAFHDVSKKISPESSRSRSLTKFPPATQVKENEQIQLPMPMTKRASQSAHILSKSRSSMDTRSARTWNGTRPSNSAPARTRNTREKEPAPIKRPSTRIFCTKTTLEQFRRHPEQFLSASNRYLPLLRRQATAMESRSRRKHLQTNSRCSDHSDVAFDEAKSFLSESDIGKPVLSLHAPSKINLMDAPVDHSSEYTLALSRLRDRQYNHLQELIRRNSSMTDILQPFSPIKRFDKPIQPTIIPAVRREKPSRNFSKLSLLVF